METITKRANLPVLSGTGEYILEQYKRRLLSEEDLTAVTIRNYLSDPRHFAVWCESLWKQGREEEPRFTPQTVATATLTDYRTYLQHLLHLRPNSINSDLISHKQYFAWLLITGQVKHDPAIVVKLIGEEVPSPLHLDDQEEQARVAAVTESGSLRDRAIVVLMLHTGLRARELCALIHTQVWLNKRSGIITVLGKRNKYREFPSNATARAALLAYDPSLKSHNTVQLRCFSLRTYTCKLTERGLSYVIKKYDVRAKVSYVNPHDFWHRFGYRMVQSVPLHRLAKIMGHNSLNTTMIYIQEAKSDLQKISGARVREQQIDANSSLLRITDLPGE
jgi:integrase/recombinase XerD